MNNSRGDNPCSSWNPNDHGGPETATPGKITGTCEHFSWYSCNDLRAMNESRSCLEYKIGYFLAVAPRIWEEIIDHDASQENWLDSCAACCGRSRPSDGYDNNNSSPDEETLGGEE
jgi:hypothetical protein